MVPTLKKKKKVSSDQKELNISLIGFSPPRFQKVLSHQSILNNSLENTSLLNAQEAILGLISNFISPDK